MATGFQGTSGRLAGAVMARLNRDMEDAAVDELGPGPADRVLAVGIGPGVGIAALVPRLPHGFVGGVDPSLAMLDQARRRNWSAVNAGRRRARRCERRGDPVARRHLRRCSRRQQHAVVGPVRTASPVQEVSRVLTIGATLVTVTHCWAVEKRAPLPSGWTRRRPHSATAASAT